MRAAPAVLVLLTAALPGCGMMEANLDVNTVCLGLPGYVIPGAGASGTVETTVAYDLGSSVPLLSQPNVRYALRLQQVELSPGPGPSAGDLGAIESVAISPLAPAGSSLPEPVLAQYVKGSDPHPTRIVATSRSGADLRRYLSSGTIELRIAAGGALPSEPWSADVQACFLLDVTVGY